MTTVRHAPVTEPAPTVDVGRIREDFPILASRVRGRPLVYLDNAATSQKPTVVVEALRRYYTEGNANIHRGVYRLSEEATSAYDSARATVQRCLNARHASEIVFVRGTTEAINLVAQSFVRPRLRAGDEIVITGMEHHSNIVPWQLVAGATGARLRVVPITDSGEISLDEYAAALTERTRLMAAVHVSNSLGTINPVGDMVSLAHQREIPVLLDGAQAVPHMPVDVQALDCDFYAFSGHKAFGPTGIGVLYGKAEHLEAMPPYQGGGDMIRSVRFDKTEFAEPPARFEAGTPHIAGAVGLGAALEYLMGLDSRGMGAHEHDLLIHATEALAALPGTRLIGTAPHKAAVVSFVLEGVHAHDIGTILDQEGVCIRTGHHCTQPVMERMGVPATARASFAFYNTHDEVDALVRALQRVRDVFAA